MAKRARSVGYFSAYYRGLECLLKMWPVIREQVPDATLDIYYGWESWLKMEGPQGKPFYDRVNKLLEELSDQGVVEHGRVNHEELAEAMKGIKVWAYPTEFPEIHCITALKAQAAGCWPVTTNVGALKETVETGTKVDCANIYSNEYGQSKFIAAVVEALKSPSGEEPHYASSCFWDEVAIKWEEVMK